MVSSCPTSDTSSDMPGRPQAAPDPSSFSGRALSILGGAPVDDRPFPEPLEPRFDEETFFEACSDSSPFSAFDRSDCIDPLAYAPFPGPSTFFFRASSRSPSSSVLRQVEKEVIPWPLKAIPPEDRQSWIDKARAEAVLRTPPTTKIVSGLFFDGRVLLSTKTVEDSMVSFLSSWFGLDLQVDPLLWDQGTSGKDSLLCVLDEELVRRKAASRSDFSMDEVRLTVGSSTIKGPLRRTWTAIRSLFSSIPDANPVVESAVLSVSGKQGVSRLFVDSSGVYKVKIPAGQGGLPRDRSIRLLRTLKEVSSVARKELLMAVSRSG